jgi:hypothetical protein
MQSTQQININELISEESLRVKNFLASKDSSTSRLITKYPSHNCFYPMIESVLLEDGYPLEHELLINRAQNSIYSLYSKGENALTVIRTAGKYIEIIKSNLFDSNENI